MILDDVTATLNGIVIRISPSRITHTRRTSRRQIPIGSSINRPITNHYYRLSLLRAMQRLASNSLRLVWSQLARLTALQTTRFFLFRRQKRLFCNIFQVNPRSSQVSIVFIIFFFSKNIEIQHLHKLPRMIMIYRFIEGKLIDFVKENYLLAFEKINRINFFFFPLQMSITSRR